MGNGASHHSGRMEKNSHARWDFPPINYFLVTTGSEKIYTPFQGFGQDVAKPPFIALLELLAVLPALMPEIFVPGSELPSLRQPITSKDAAIIGLNSFRLVMDAEKNARRILVVLSAPDLMEEARSIVREIGAIFVSTKALNGAIGLEAYNGHPAQLLDMHLRDAFAMHLPPDEQQSLLQVPLRLPFGIGDKPSRIAGVTIPNERLCMSLGYTYSGTAPLGRGQEGEYESAILDSAHHALSLIGKEFSDTIVYAPSIARHLYSFGSTFWNNLFRKIKSKVTREIIKDGVLRNRGYSGYRFEYKADDMPDNPYDDPIAGGILQTRQIELRLTAAGVANLATSEMKPAIRLPNSINFHVAELREIERHANRSDARGKRLLQAAYKELSRKLCDEIDTRLLSYLKERAEAITVIADAPVEWIRMNGLPLMIEHEMSRIGMTPGNFMLERCVDSKAIVFPAKALLEILVIRSFNEKDPVRSHLEFAVEKFNLSSVQIKIVDVQNTEDLIEALNAFSGIIVIFDCHGGHDGDEKNGWLMIGKEKVDAWQLAYLARIPPIVILSACSTYALAGSHASVGNGLLRSGAVTVIGTLLAVDSLRSAMFVARLLYRIDTFLPAIQKLGVNFITWRMLVSTYLRMSYATDLLLFFISDKQWLDASYFEEVAFNANQDINSVHNDWYGRLIQGISKRTGKSTDELQSTIEHEMPLSETMYYCQIGRPEMIGIYLDDMH